MDDERKASVREIVGLNIAKLRTAAGLSQNDLGIKLERWLESSWSRQAVSQAEQGKRAFGVDDLVALSIGLDASIHQLLTPSRELTAVELASGTELSALAYKEVVLGGDADIDEIQRSRIIGQLRELDLLASGLVSRQQALRELLGSDSDQLDEDAVHAVEGAPYGIKIESGYEDVGDLSEHFSSVWASRIDIDSPDGNNRRKQKAADSDQK